MLYLGKIFVIGALLINTPYLAALEATDHDLKNIELKISSTAERKHKYTADIEHLDHKYHTLKQELHDLQTKLNGLKANIKKTIRSEFFLKNKSMLKMIFENNQGNHNVPGILFYEKINTYQAKKIGEYLKLLQHRKDLTQELTQNLTSLSAVQIATQQEINTLKTAYTERSKILQLNVPNTKNLGEIKIKTTIKPTGLHADKITANPLTTIKPAQIYYMQKNRAIIHADEGSKVFAINNGKIVFCGWMRGYGIIIIIDHGENLMSLYGHNQTTFKKSGDHVKKGEVISLVGKSGGHEKPGLYFEIRKNGISINLNKWLKTTG